MHVHGYDVLERRNFNTTIKLEGAPKVMTIVPSYSEMIYFVSPSDGILIIGLSPTTPWKVTKNLKTEIYAVRLKNEFYMRFMKHQLVFLACHF